MDGFNQYVPPNPKILFRSDKRYHVFLSFRGPDVRKTFVDHLYEALSSAGLRVFFDTYELEKGDIIDPTLKAAIESSAICIPIFSKGYASSVWCLREATCIVNSTGRIIPLFYDMEPTHVRFPQGRYSPYAPYFDEHYRSDRYEIEEIEGWKQSLRKICARSGWSKELTGGYEGQLIKKVTWDVIKSLDKVPFDVATHPVGLKDTKQELIQRLYLDSANDLIRLGILGIGGIGKTTLVKAVYNEVYSRFDGSCFLFNVRATAGMPSGLMKLQGKLLKDLAKYVDKVSSIDEGKALMRDRLGGVRSLVVLDDVDSLEQLQSLLGDWMAPGSRVLVTSRDRSILNHLIPDEISNQFIYEVSGLKPIEALQLFSWHAFLRSSPDQQYEDVSNSIVEACQGHPLSLELIGAFLYDKKKEKHIGCWKEAPVKIGGWEKIFETLFISYSALSPLEKEIFLDIACLFKGEKKTHHFVFWQSLGNKQVISAISNLEMKLLLKIDNEGVFDMHDHLQEMGRTIVEREFLGDADHERSRVWETKHACNQHKSAYLINQHISRLRLQGGCLPYKKVWKTPKLRLLHMEGIKMEPGTVKLPPNLIWLRLESCSLASEGSVSPKWGPCFSFDGHDWQLRIMELRKCRELERLPSLIGNLSKLQSLTVSKCDKLKNLPDSLGKLSQLESLDVSGCRELERLPSRIGNLSKLQYLTVARCYKLKSLPESLGKLSQLQSLDVSGCGELERLPSSIGNLSKLQSLTVFDCYRLKNLPDSLGKLSQIESLHVSCCEELERLPKSIGNLSKLLSLTVSDCYKLKNLPDSLGKLSQLKSLDVSRCEELERLPSSMGNLSKLQSLTVSFCYKLKNLPDSLGKLSQLESLHVSRCEEFERLPSSIGNLSKLQSLRVFECDKLKNLPDSLGNLSKLESLRVFECDKLKNLPQSLGKLSQLESLDVFRCAELERLPSSIGNLSKLQSLSLSECYKLKNLSNNLGNLSQLESLDVSGCGELERLPSSIGNLSKLQSLTVSECKKLKNLPDSLGKLSQLESLDVSGCRELERLPSSIGNLSKLQSLTVCDSDKLKNLPDSLGKLSQLKSLEVSGCGELERLPSSIGNLSKLQSLRVSECKKLNNLPDSLGKLSQLVSLDLSDCKRLKNLPKTIGDLAQLTSLKLNYCCRLENLPDTLGNLTHLESLSLYDCSSFKNLPDSLSQLESLQWRG